MQKCLAQDLELGRAMLGDEARDLDVWVAVPDRARLLDEGGPVFLEVLLGAGLLVEVFEALHARILPIPVAGQEQAGAAMRNAACRSAGSKRRPTTCVTRARETPSLLAASA